MPIYEFKCMDCSDTVELLMSRKEELLNVQKCLKCGGLMYRQASVPSPGKVQGGTPKFYQRGGKKNVSTST